MTWPLLHREVVAAIEKIALTVEDKTGVWKDVKVYFDFPLDGVAREYEIAKISEKGIMLRNPTCERPAGH